MSGDPEVYRIESMRDLLAVPPDRLSECLRGLEYVLALYQLALADDPDVGPMIYEWTDDGLASVSLCDEHGEEFLTLAVTQAPRGRNG